MYYKFKVSKNKIRFAKMIILELLKSGQITQRSLLEIHKKIIKKHKLNLFTKHELLKAYQILVKKQLIKPNKFIEEILRKRKIRSLSGIVVVSVLTKPYKCPGKCIYCPTQKGIPKSYLKNEPAVMRAVLNNFDPYLQVQNRLTSLSATGHPISKINLRTIGGTWSYYPRQYREWFIRRCFEGSNAFKLKDKRVKFKDKKDDRKIRSGKLEEVQKENEQSKHRIVEISVETRPDYINVAEIKRLRSLGITKVELGIQSVYDDVLEKVKRGHDVQTTISATKMLRDAGFKIAYQIMFNLPGSNILKDKKMIRELFSNPNFCPDYLKIYPLAIVKEAEIYDMYKHGKFKPYSKEQLIELIKFSKLQIPYYCRIERIIRDIPHTEILAGGAKFSNLRQYLHQVMKEEGLSCRCIRCREVRGNYNPNEKIMLLRQDYEASCGREIFLSYETKNRDKIFGMLRLRIPQQSLENKKHFLAVLDKSAIIREVHTYGQQLEVASKDKNAAQHKGLGKKLIKKAEAITRKEFALKKIAVISGVGVRDYFRDLGYKLKNTYMVKKF